MPSELRPEDLFNACDPAQFRFETTADLSPPHQIIGQPRGVRAIQFGIDIDSPGYNVYVLGESGTGRMTAITGFLEARAVHAPVPEDWAYVNNFAEPYKPRALNLPPGWGARLRDEMANTIGLLRKELPKAFDTDAYRNAEGQIAAALNRERQSLLDGLNERVTAEGFALVRTPEGLMILPTAGGAPMPPEQFAALPDSKRQALEAARHKLDREMERVMRDVREVEKESQDRLQTLQRQVAASAVAGSIEDLKAHFQSSEETLLYLEEVRQDIITNVTDFLGRPAEGTPGGPPGPVPPEDPFTRYRVNLIVDHGLSQGAPVVVELNPTTYNLVGRIEHQAGFGGALTTDFTLIKAGALQRANGGYLVLRAKDVFAEPQAWETLKRALIGGRAQIEDAALMRAQAAMAKTLDPEAIPLHLKVVLIGVPQAYYGLFSADEDFQEVFKVKADFDVVMDRNPENVQQYAAFVATRCQDEGLRAFNREAVSRVVEYGSRLAEDQHRLSTLFGDIADLVREANYWAGYVGHERVTGADVVAAIRERVRRSNLAEERLRERITQGTIFIDTDDEVIGQVNGLSVTSLADYRFALPSRVTARTFMGRAGVVQIDREVNLAGPIHNKGVLTLAGYLGGRYAADIPLALSAQITFEQNYGGVEGDSAACAELYALLSSLAEVPLRQSIAVTGSVNQRGEVQPIGDATVKVEGFFEVCRARELTGRQGVMVPASNRRNLNLSDEAVTAVREGRFHVWPVATIDEGLEVLTGQPAGQIHEAVKARLRYLAEGLERFREAMRD